MLLGSRALGRSQNRCAGAASATPVTHGNILDLVRATYVLQAGPDLPHIHNITKGESVLAAERRYTNTQPLRSGSADPRSRQGSAELFAQCASSGCFWGPAKPRLHWRKTGTDRFVWDLPSPWGQPKRGKHKPSKPDQAVP